MYADSMGKARPIKYTTVAPTGTISLLSGHTAGIHPVQATHFIRRVRYANNSPHLKNLDANVPVEDDLYSENTKVVSYLCRDPILTRMDSDLIETISDLSVDQQLYLQFLVQSFWADNAVSFTAQLPPDMTKEELVDVLQTYCFVLKGVTVYPSLSRPQQPITAISEEEYNDLASTMQTEESQSLDEDCASGACPIK